MGLITENKDEERNDSLNREAYKKAISQVESSGGKNLSNSTSSATGKYQFLYNSIKNDPDMDGVSKREFMNRDDLQELIMDKALDGKLTGYAYGENYAKRLKRNYASKLSTHEITALVHFLGAGNVKKYLTDPKTFKVPGVNKSPESYLKVFNNTYNAVVDEEKQKALELSEKNNEEQVLKAERKNPQPNERFIGQRQVDATAVAQPQMIKDINSFLEGGKLEGELNGADALVTLFENGGTHEENALGGIPQGVGKNGKPNLVEEGETKWNDYIFSNSFDLDGNFDLSLEGNSGNIFEDGGDEDGNKKVIGPMPVEEPLSVTRKDPYSQVQETMVIPDVRNKYITPDYVSSIPGQLDWETVKKQNPQAVSFIDRYNTESERKKLAESTGLSQEELDNVILKGATTKISTGNVGTTANAFFDNKENIIKTNPGVDEATIEHEFAHASGLDMLQAPVLQKILGNTYHQKNVSSSAQMKKELNKPYEAYGHFVGFRKRLGIKPGATIKNEAQLDALIKAKKLENEPFYKSFDKKKIIKALNEVAYQSDNNNFDNYKIS